MSCEHRVILREIWNVTCQFDYCSKMREKFPLIDTTSKNLSIFALNMEVLTKNIRRVEIPWSIKFSGKQITAILLN